MRALRGPTWGPRPLPEFLVDQLATNGYAVDDSGRIARQINEGDHTTDAASLFVDLGSCKFLEGDIDGAVATWRHAISGDADMAASQALLNLGLLYEHLHLHEQALNLLAAVADRGVERWVVPAALASARCQVARGDADQAMETMARLAQLMMANHPDGPELIEALYGLGDVAVDAGRPDRAERSWRVAAASPSSRFQEAAATRLAELFAHLGHDDELLDLAEESRSAGRDDAAAQLAYATVLLRIGRDDAAASVLDSIAGPDLDEHDRFRLAEARVQSGRVNPAIDEYEALLAQSDPNVRLRAAYCLGELYRDYDMADAALAMYERVSNANDRYWSPKAELVLGDLCSSTGDAEAAEVHWEQAGKSELRVIAQQAQDRLEGTGPAVGRVSPPDPHVIELDAIEPERAETESGASVVVAPADEPVSGASVVVAPADEPVSGASVVVAPADEPVSAAPVPEEQAPAATSGRPAEVPTAEDVADDQPIVVVLSSLEDEAPNGTGPAASDQPTNSSNNGSAAEAEQATVIDLSEAEERDPAAASPVHSAFASQLGKIEPSNPYASLAPEGAASDVPATTRNPYAELAPNYDGDDFQPPAGVEPGDWESMLSDWPRDDPKPRSKRSSAFSRYT